MQKEVFLYQFVKAYNFLDHKQTNLSAKVYFQEVVNNGLYIYFLRNIIIHELTSDIDFDYLNDFVGFEEIMTLFECDIDKNLKEKLDGYIIDRFGINFLDSGFVLSPFNQDNIQVLYEKKTRFEGLTKKILIQNNYQNISYIISNFSYINQSYLQISRNPDINNLFLNNGDKIILTFNPLDSSFNLKLEFHHYCDSPIELLIDSYNSNWIISIPDDKVYDKSFEHLKIKRVNKIEKAEEEIIFWKIFRYYFNDIYDLIKYLMREIKRFENEILNNFKTNKIKELYDRNNN
jgi:hypothetical protein